MYLFRILDEERVQTEHLQQTRVGHFRLALLAVLLFYRLGRADDAVLVLDAASLPGWAASVPGCAVALLRDAASWLLLQWLLLGGG